MKKASRARRKVRDLKGQPRRGVRAVSGRRRVTGGANDATPEPVAQTAEAIAIKQVSEDERIQTQRKNRKCLAKASADLLASYMEQLSHIPLFSPDQEVTNARHLRLLDRHSWQLLLEHPRATSIVAACFNTEEATCSDESRALLEKLCGSYERALKRSRRADLPPNKARNELIQALSASLRRDDHDKEQLDSLIQRLEREIWARKQDQHPALNIEGSMLEELQRRRRVARRAHQNFVRANLRLVVSVARMFNHYKVAFIDLIQEGNVGLMKAVNRFDPERGFRFSTYAHWWIRQSVERAIINKGNQVRLPVHVVDARRQVRRSRARLEQKLERPATIEEIATDSCLEVAKVESILGGVQQEPISLDESLGHDDPRCIGDLIKDNHESAEAGVLRTSTFAQMADLLLRLNPIEKDIIRRRFGLESADDQTLDEIGQVYNLSRERVRQIQAQGLQKMRRMCERRDICLPA